MSSNFHHSDSWYKWQNETHKAKLTKKLTADGEPTETNAFGSLVEMGWTIDECMELFNFGQGLLEAASQGLYRTPADVGVFHDEFDSAIAQPFLDREGENRVDPVKYYGNYFTLCPSFKRRRPQTIADGIVGNRLYRS